MPPAASTLPQAHGHLMLTDSGVETDVIFRTGRDLPSFALFPLLDDAEGVGILRRYYREHLDVSAAHGFGYVLETPTWRSTPDWGHRLGYTTPALDDLDARSVAFMQDLRADAPVGIGRVVVSALLGPRGDGYAVGAAMSSDVARRYHSHQVEVFAGSGADLVSACTLTYVDEALGIARAAEDAGVPVVLHFTVETDGRLPEGTSLEDAVTRIDDATGGYVAYYGINCAHPEHIEPAVGAGDEWTRRIGALRANASRMSHAELDAAEDLDDGDPQELAQGYRRLLTLLPEVRVLGGCCGTDVRHLREIASVIAA